MPQETVNKIAEIINTRVSQVDGKAIALQNVVNKEVRSLLLKHPLETTKTGAIKRTGSNLKQVNLILKKLQKVLKGEVYKKTIAKFADTFEFIELTNASYFRDLAKEITRPFSNKPIYRDLTILARERTLETINPEAFRGALEKPISDLIRNFVRTGGELSQLSVELTNGILGAFNESGDQVALGYLQNYGWRNRITRDALFQHSRNYVDLAASDLDIEYYKFLGPDDKVNRSWCDRRIRKVFHIREIREKWPKETWQGKARGTNSSNITTELGGYNCRHSLYPVPDRLVPAPAVARAKRLGYVE